MHIFLPLKEMQKQKKALVATKAFSIEYICII